MTDVNKSVFTFDLNESLWFKKGQEVDEIMGISLDPEISIQEFDDFVSIRGVIELKGEYYQVSDSAEEEDHVLSFRDHPSQRFIDRVDSYEDGVNEFFHSFPVEISIPKYRIDSVEDLMVGVDSFDYELPENSQLLLNASVAIHGVKEDRKEPLSNYEADREEETPSPNAIDYPMESSPVAPPEPPVGEEFSFDVKEKAEPEEELEENVPYETNELVGRDELKVEVEEVEEVEEVQAQKETNPEKEKPRWKKKSQSFAEFFAKPELEKEEDVEESSSSMVTENESSSLSPDVVSIHAHHQKDDYDEEDMDEDREGETNEHVKEDTLYLLSMFENKEERLSSMKMCIVQESDTLDSIAEKYEISPLNISKMNRLEDDDLTAGQILYIPVNA